MALIVVEEKNILTILSAPTVTYASRSWMFAFVVRFLSSSLVRYVDMQSSLLYLFAAVLSTMNMCFGRRIDIYVTTTRYRHEFKCEANGHTTVVSYHFAAT